MLSDYTDEQVFWQKLWKEEKSLWLLPHVNHYLIQYLHRLNLKKGDTILVPLCGNSLDLIWLAQQGFKVIGVEIVAEAIQLFFEKHNIPFQVIDNIYHASNRLLSLRIFHQNFFQLDETLIPDVKAIYDRAAFTAIPPQKRLPYIKKLKSVGNKAPLLLITCKHSLPDRLLPYSIKHHEVIALFKSFYLVNLLAVRSINPIHHITAYYLS